MRKVRVMTKKKKITIVVLTIVVSMAIILLTVGALARFVFLAPSCYADNVALTDEENYWIKKTVLETVEQRYSVLSERGDGTHLFVCINTDFMDSVKQTGEREYQGYIQTCGMEETLEDGRIRFTLDLDANEITAWELDP